jgi:hypothetical protein
MQGELFIFIRIPKFWPSLYFQVDKTPTPEPLGVIAAAVYLIFIFSFIPVLYNAWNDEQDVVGSTKPIKNKN